MFVHKKCVEDGKTFYEIGAIINGVWFVESEIENHDDARQMVNYLNGGEKKPDCMKAQFSFIVIGEDMPPKLVGPVKSRDTRNDLARQYMSKVSDDHHVKLYALTWERDYFPTIKPFPMYQLKMGKKMYLGKCWIIQNDYDMDYADHFTFHSYPDDADENYIKALLERHKGYKPDPHQDDTWQNENGRSIEANGYNLVPGHHEHVVREYIK
jgi:hypothetical protein